MPSLPSETRPTSSSSRSPMSMETRSTRTCWLPAAPKTATPLARQESTASGKRGKSSGVKGTHLPPDGHVPDIDPRVGAGRDEAGQDPAREAAEAGREHLVGADPHARGDAVRGEAVQRAGDAARDPGAVALEVAVAAVAQALAVDDAEPVEGDQVRARDEVAAERPVEHALELLVVRL